MPNIKETLAAHFEADAQVVPPQEPPVPSPETSGASLEAVLRATVEAYHRERCNLPTWQGCRNPVCVQVQAVLK